MQGGEWWFSVMWRNQELLVKEQKVVLMKDETGVSSTGGAV